MASTTQLTGKLPRHTLPRFSDPPNGLCEVTRFLFNQLASRPLKQFGNSAAGSKKNILSRLFSDLQQSLARSLICIRSGTMPS